MADTIELLEAIGRDASLRHASAEELAKALEQAQASDGLTAAVATGDNKWLFNELGYKPMEPPQGTQGPCREEEEPEEDGDIEQPAQPSPDSGQSFPDR